MPDRQTKRACDRCHAVKEKCRWIDAQETCDRCLRLRFVCHTHRPLATVGRKPRHHPTKTIPKRKIHQPPSESNSTSSSTSFDVHTTPPYIANGKVISISRTLSIFIDLDTCEKHLLDTILHGETRIEQFLVGPSFVKCHQRVFLKYLGMATPLLKDALLASTALIACDHDDLPISRNRQIGHKRAASAISALRSLSLFHPDDVSAVLIFAALMVTFALHISGTAFPICRHTLDLVKPFYESSAELDSDGLAFLLCLIHSETLECLLRCEIPTIRFRVQRDDLVVDRYMGITSPLLPHFYDICKISHALRYCKTNISPRTLEALEDVEIKVNQWKPTLPEHFITCFTPAEVVSMLAQAKVHRWTILLISHRLRHAYGTETSKGFAISDAILEELYLTVRLTRRSVPCVEIAFVVACFEITDPEKRKVALDMTENIIGFSKQLQIRTRSLITSFWATWNVHNQLHWYNVDLCLPQ
ncbi:hypothetical protein K505DRAFT_307716 [Melanomma pulvis-pyrius CBS 109.77]|uniref:Zn(2)-C6 fungal-type domain-containing protein n=1 Tax=Melanomma pulvis-pyrius CBS 109.77 TaxID=1314802 RepID=A0A6A6X7Z8_9PLEO|nr:hypothetical protein K505DRAFT_307716 [Melanomma pulvis-pyrius CBS 109.77]